MLIRHRGSSGYRLLPQGFREKGSYCSNRGREMATFSRNLSRRSSVATIPSSEGAHRLDLLIQEQRTSVINAQEALRQSMAILERAHSKEEKESAKMQVQSLMTRAEELTFLMTVVHAIRTELKHILADIETCRKNRQSPHPLYARQQWLESRLEALLLAKKRGRPGGRAQRTQQNLSQRVVQQRQFAPGGRKQQLDTISSLPQSTQDSFDCLSDSTRPTSPTNRETSITPILILPKPEGSVKADTRGDRYRANMANTSFAFKSESTAVSTCLTESNESWHSDSEANWTLPGGSVRQFNKDLGVSVTPSELAEKSSSKEGDRLGLSSVGGKREPGLQKRVSVSFMDLPSTDLKEQRKDYPLPTITKRNEGEAMVEVAKVSKLSARMDVSSSSSKEASDNMVSSIAPVQAPAEIVQNYDFELPRSSEVFGECSWNVLPLATRSNLVQPVEEQDQSFYDESFRDVSAVRGVLDNFCVEADILKQLIAEASQASVKSGPLVSASKKSALRSHSKNSSARTTGMNTSTSAATSSTDTRTVMLRRSSTVSGTLPPIAAATAAPKKTFPRSSRHLYGINKLEDYPRSSTCWNQASTTRATSLTRTTTHERLMFSHIDRSLEKYQNASNGGRKVSQKSKRSSSVPGTMIEDLFQKDKFRQRRIEHMCKQLDSSNAEIRKDNVQALGQLSTTGECVKDRLLKLLSSDEDMAVRYRALYSLLQQGVATAEIVAFIVAFLSRGSPVIQVELLQLVFHENILGALLEKLKDGECKVCSSLHTTLEDLLREGEGPVPALAAKLLSHAQMSQDKCTECLKGLLSSSEEEVQNMALESLCLWWRCSEEPVLDAALEQMAGLAHWKFRRRAVECLCEVNRELEKSKGSQPLFKTLTARLRNEPMLAVRVAIGKLLKLLKLAGEAQELFLSDLNRSDEVLRNNAVLAITAFELKEKATTLALLEVMMLDPSLYVRVQVVRAFGGMTHYDTNVITSLIKRSQEHGILARASTSALNTIHKHLEESAGLQN